MGTQLIDFLNRIKSVAEKDIYIKGALYLYDSKKNMINMERICLIEIIQIQKK